MNGKVCSDDSDNLCAYILHFTFPHLKLGRKIEIPHFLDKKIQIPFTPPKPHPT